jgi:glycosyltransferase involved in cell wall biosynthesis
MINVEIFIITRDRPNYLVQAFNSIVAQQGVPNNFKIKIVISDNSVSPCTDIHSQLNQLCEIRVRGGLLGAIEHFNVVLSEVTADYFLMLHDDDFFAPNYLKKVLTIVTEEKDVVAVAVNGLRFSEQEMKLTLPSVYGEILPRTLILERYYARVLNCFDIGIPPVSGFIFSNSASVIRFNLAEGGKHCDISFIGKVIELGKVVQIKDCLLYVREHLHNDSNSEKYTDRVSLIRYISRALHVGSNWWLFDVYRWQCSNRALANAQDHNTHLLKISNMLVWQPLIGRVISIKYLIVKMISKVCFFYDLKAYNEVFIKLYRDLNIVDI